MHQTMIKAALDRAQPGSRVKGVVPVGTMASGATIGISFVAIKGTQDGPCLWINGQVHGVEINGIFSALEFVNSLNAEELAGSVVVTATANPPAFDAREKCAPQDGYDLDQTFPGNIAGFLTERLAYRYFEEVKGCADVLINMHTNGPLFDGKPYAVYKDHPRVEESTLLDLLSAFDPSVACLMQIESGKGELLGNIAGGLDFQMLNLGIPSFMIELGGGSRAEADFITQGVEGFRGVAGKMKLIKNHTHERTEVTRVTARRHITVTHGGLFRASQRPGDFVAAGSSLGYTLNMFGEVVEELACAKDSIVICIRRDPVVHTGDRFAFLAEKWERIQLK